MSSVGWSRRSFELPLRSRSCRPNGREDPEQSWNLHRVKYATGIELCSTWPFKAHHALVFLGLRLPLQLPLASCSSAPFKVGQTEASDASTGRYSESLSRLSSAYRGLKSPLFGLGSLTVSCGSLPCLRLPDTTEKSISGPSHFPSLRPV